MKNAVLSLINMDAENIHLFTTYHPTKFIQTFNKTFQLSVKSENPLLSDTKMGLFKSRFNIHIYFTYCVSPKIIQRLSSYLQNPECSCLGAVHNHFSRSLECQWPRRAVSLSSCNASCQLLHS